MADQTISVVFELLGTIPDTNIEFYHETLVYKDANGNTIGVASMAWSNTNVPKGTAENFISSEVEGNNGLPTVFGTLVVNANPDLSQLLAPANPVVPVYSGADLTSQWNTILATENAIASQNLTYTPMGYNSNYGATTALIAAGISPPTTDIDSLYFAPSSYNSPVN